MLAFVPVKSYAVTFTGPEVMDTMAGANGAKSWIGGQVWREIVELFINGSLEYIAGRWRESLTSTIVPFHDAINQPEGK